MPTAKFQPLPDNSLRHIQREYDFAAALLRTTKFLAAEQMRCPERLRADLFRNIVCYLEYLAAPR